MLRWRRWLLWLAIVITFLKVWLPDSMLAPLGAWVDKADEVVRSVYNLVAEKPVRGSKKWVVSSKGRYQGRVDDVHDGDTVHVQDVDGKMHKVRLANIDAPEIKQAFGISSRDALKARIFNQNVDVNVVAVDQYQREVGQIMLNNNDINLWMIQKGYAWHYDVIAQKQQNQISFNRYHQAQVQAKQQRLGLWHGARAIAPWQFRKQQKAS